MNISWKQLMETVISWFHKFCHRVSQNLCYRILWMRAFHVRLWQFLILKTILWITFFYRFSYKQHWSFISYFVDGCFCLVIWMFMLSTLICYNILTCFTFFNIVSLEQIMSLYLKKLFSLWLNFTFNYSTWNLIWW
jgi:hypothetical protein